MEDWPIEAALELGRAGKTEKAAGGMTLDRKPAGGDAGYDRPGKERSSMDDRP